ncbi:MAG: SPOR domain-containing protein, partial [Hyphomicrobiaceae bacterium]|nr:SPOR domain-containing protein [Hyphomicrobiaceae bacterium]
ASLALPFDIGLARQPQVAEGAVDPAQGIELATRALGQIDTVEHTVNEIAKDVERIKETVDQHDLHEKEAQSRLTALEERVTNLSTPPPAPVAAATPSAKQKAADTAKASADKQREAAARIVSAMEQGKVVAAPAAQPKLETGSLPGTPSNITFGEPQVTPAQPYTVQLASGPSLDALRMSWLALRDQHGNALGSLQPRYVAPRGGTGTYRLLVGPLPSKADAEKVCANLGLTHHDCFATTSLGKPL